MYTQGVFQSFEYLIMLKKLLNYLKKIKLHRVMMNLQKNLYEGPLY